MRRSGIVALLVGLGVAACDSTGPEDGAGVSIRFETVAAPALAAQGAGAAADFSIAGSNGTLTLTDVHFIVDEFELERVEDSCEAGSTASRDDGDDHEDDECEEFESGPFFVGLDLDSDVTVTAEDVPAGTYRRFKFKVEDTEFDEGDGDHHTARIGDLMQEIVDEGFTDWPRNASMVVSGVFTPVGGTPKPFTVYLEAELRILQVFEPPLVVENDPGTVTVVVDPSRWFHQENGTVIDLSAWDFDTTHRVVEFETRIGDGFRRIEHDGHD